MPTFNVTVPGGKVLTVNAPEGATPQQAIEFAAKAWQPTPGMNPVEDMSGIQKFLAGMGKAPVDAYRGIKEMLGQMTPQEIDQQRQLDKPLMNTGAGFAGNVAGNIGTYAPLAMVPGANTVAGAGLTGAAIGATQPVGTGESRAMNTALGAGTSALAQYGGNKLAGYLQNRAKQNIADLASQQAKNAVRDQTLQEAQQAGYVIPRSQYNPSFMSNRLESIAGKAATKQAAAAKAQDVTNSLAKQALGVPDDSALSVSTLERIRNVASKPYQEVANLSPLAAKDLEALKQARNDAQGWFNAYNRSASPADLAKAKDFRTMAETLEKNLENYAAQAGRNDLIPTLRAARKQIAQTYTVQRALNNATGDISAPVIGRLYDKGKPLSGGLETIGKFRSAFPQISQEGAKVPTAGVSKSEAIMGTLLGVGSALGTGHPAGLLTGLIPLMSHPARSLALSSVMQKAPSYAPGLLNRSLQYLDPQTASLIARMGAIPMITQ